MLLSHELCLLYCGLALTTVVSIILVFAEAL